MGVAPSMGSVGDCFDNPMAESFFASLECELTRRRAFRTQAEARMAISEYMEDWHNPRRRHSGLGCQSPPSFERSKKRSGLIARPSTIRGNGCSSTTTRATAQSLPFSELKSGWNHWPRVASRFPGVKRTPALGDAPVPCEAAATRLLAKQRCLPIARIKSNASGDRRRHHNCASMHPTIACNPGLRRIAAGKTRFPHAVRTLQAQAPPGRYRPSHRCGAAAAGQGSPTGTAFGC